MTEEERRLYIEFMYNPDNIGNCENCPANDGFEGLPCGQQNCWVRIHVESAQED